MLDAIFLWLCDEAFTAASDTQAIISDSGLGVRHEYAIQGDLQTLVPLDDEQEIVWKFAKMFTFCPLLGAQSESAASQSLLELDGGVKILIDVGWDESFDVQKLKELEK